MTIISTLLVFIIGYASYFLISRSSSIQKYVSGRFGEKRALLSWIVIQRGIGAVCLGVFPAVLVMCFPVWRFPEIGLSLNLSGAILLWTAGLGGCVLVISYLVSKKTENLQIYPQIREHTWTLSTVMLNAMSWIIYLFAYEFMFRGLVLFSLDSILGLWPAVAITTVLYVLVHIPKGLKEALGALPFGVILGFITLKAGSIWPAFFIHVLLALSSDFLAVSAHPEMRFNLTGKKTVT